MECLNPIWLTETSDMHGQYVPCSKCYSCLQKKRAVWTFRMMQETKDAESGYFVTLTYDKEHLPLIDQWNFTVASLDKVDLTKFFKRLRKNVIKYGTSDDPERWFKPNGNSKIRYFACGEYGKKGDRPHYHIILWNLPDYFIEYDPIHKKMYSELIEETWEKGLVDIGKVEQASCHYVAKYILDPLISGWTEHDNRQRPYATMSRNPGVGINYVNDEIKKYFTSNKNSFALTEGNIKQPLGRYYKEKIFEDDPKAYRAMRNKARDIAIQQRQNKEENIRRSYKGNDPYGHYLQIEREERESANRKIKRIIKQEKL